MSTVLTVKAVEKSTYVVTAAFTDEDGAAVVPASPVVWTLTDADGTQIATGSVPAAAEVIIVLTCDDLAVTEQVKTTQRIIIVETTYDSSLGSGLCLRDSATFFLENIMGIQ